MANWSDLKASVAEVIKTNSNQEITGQILQNTLNSIISNVGANATFAGIAMPTTNPGTPDGNLFYLATEPGTYANFNGIEIADGEAVILEWRGSWTKKTSGFATQKKLTELKSRIISYLYTSGQYNMFKSIEYNGHVATIRFNSNNYALGIGGIDDKDYGAIEFTAEDEYILKNGDGLVLNIETNRIEKLDGIYGDGYKEIGTNKIFLLINILYKLVSPYPLVQSMIDEYIGGYKLYIFRTQYAKNLFSLANSPDELKLNLKFSSTENNMVFGLGGIYNRDYGSADIFSDETFLLNNGDGLAIDLDNNSIIKITSIYGNGYKELNGINKIFLGINIYGYLYSPFPIVQQDFDQTFYGTKNIRLNGGDIQDYIDEKLSPSDVPIGINLCYTSKVILTNTAHGTTNYPYKIDKSETATGLYAETIDDSNADEGMSHQAYIKSCNKVKYIIQYTADKSVVASLYFQDKDNKILNYGSQVTVYLEISDQIKTLIIESDYVEEAVKTNLYFGTTHDSTGPLAVGTNLKIYSCQCIAIGEGYNENEITITPDGSFCQIRNAINNIQDASNSNRYKIIVKNGYYEEIDIKTKDYVDVVGESKERVILYCDGLSTKLAPTDYGWAELEGRYDGVPINTIPKVYKHLFLHTSDSTVKNMTLISNQTKYVIHQDAAHNKYIAACENCNIIRKEDYNNPTQDDKRIINLVGVGSEGGQYQIYRNCNFRMQVKGVTDEVLFGGFAVYWHNWNNQKYPCGLTIENCNIFGCNIAYLAELGSEQDDIVNIINTAVDNDMFGIRYYLEKGYYKKNGAVVENADDIPYNIQLILKNTKVNYLYLENERLKGIDKVINTETICSQEVDSAVLMGQPIDIVKGCWYKAGISIGDTKWGFAMENSSDTSDSIIYINKGLVGLGLAVSNSYNYGDAMYISNGKFTKEITGNQVGECMETKLLSNDGLLVIRKIVE